MRNLAAPALQFALYASFWSVTHRNSSNGKRISSQLSQFIHVSLKPLRYHIIYLCVVHAISASMSEICTNICKLLNAACCTYVKVYMVNTANISSLQLATTAVHTNCIKASVFSRYKMNQLSMYSAQNDAS